MSEKKVVRRSVAIALGIICIILAVGLVGALAYYESMTNTKSSQDQTNPQTWIERKFSFKLNADNISDSNVYADSTKYTIPTGGFRSLTIMIDAGHLIPPSTYIPFQVCVGSIVNGTVIDYQVYDVLSNSAFPRSFLLGGPPWGSEIGVDTTFWFKSFGQTFEIHSSEIVVWIWNNSTVNIWGDMYYYLTA